ncbi:hypothetical protein [Oligella urethralis]|uniref:hypothetical protein n=1 Tax=Oligella urethralis TaxID=90245 RepID=UPI00124AE7EA|nr:hypothetical protein [Oligella urethralis]
MPARYPTPLAQLEAARRCWSIDFMSDGLANQRRFRTLNVIDDFNPPRKKAHYVRLHPVPTQVPTTHNKKAEKSILGF